MAREGSATFNLKVQYRCKTVSAFRKTKYFVEYLLFFMYAYSGKTEAAHVRSL